MTSYILIGGGILGVLLLAIGIVVSNRSDRTLVDDRINKYLEAEDKSAGGEANESKGALTDWVNKRVEKSSYGDKLARDLARADLKLGPGEFIALYFIAVIGLGLILF